MAPKISIVFTSYNHNEFLVEALESLFNQTFKDFEIIIIDDCSTDGSQDILIRYKDDPRVKLYLLPKNTGSYVHSSNLGASKATTDFLIFAQCDDFSENTQLEKLYNAMQKNPNIGVVFSCSKLIDQNNSFITYDFNLRTKRFRKKCKYDTLISGSEMKSFFYQSCVIPNLSAALIKRSLYEKINGFSPKYLVLADWDFWLKMTLECDFYYIRESLNNFRQHDTTIRNSIKLKKQVNEVFEMFYGFFEIANVGLIERFCCEFSISQIWINYFWSGKLAWIKSFFSLLFVSFKKSFYFPIIFSIKLLMYPIRIIGRRLSRVNSFLFLNGN